MKKKTKLLVPQGEVQAFLQLPLQRNIFDKLTVEGERLSLSRPLGLLAGKVRLLDRPLYVGVFDTAEAAGEIEPARGIFLLLGEEKALYAGLPVRDDFFVRRPFFIADEIEKMIGIKPRMQQNIVVAFHKRVDCAQETVSRFVAV